MKRKAKSTFVAPLRATQRAELAIRDRSQSENCFACPEDAKDLGDVAKRNEPGRAPVMRRQLDRACSLCRFDSQYRPILPISCVTKQGRRISLLIVYTTQSLWFCYFVFVMSVDTFFVSFPNCRDVLFYDTCRTGCNSTVVSQLGVTATEAIKLEKEGANDARLIEAT